MPSRKWLLVAGAIVLVIAGVTAFLTLAPSHHHHDPSASSPNIVGTTSTSQTIVVPPDFLNSPPAISKSGSSSTTGWQVADSFTNKSIALAGVSCPTAQECFAVGETTLKTGLILVSTDGGTTWTQRSVPSGVGSLDAIACPSATECIAVGGITAITTLDGGTTWTVQLLGKKSLNGIACPTTSECIAVGESTAPVSGCDSGASFTTLDAGHTWLSTVLPCLVPEGVSCPTAAECELVGTTNNGNQESGQILGSTNRGTRWSVQYTMGGGDTQMLAITCPTTEVCEAVGDAPVQPILRTTTAGATWVPQHLPAPPGLSYFTAVACQTIQLCQAVGSAPPLDTVDGGATWLLSTVSSSISKMTGVTCPSSSSCVAVADGVIPGGVILRLST